MRTMTIIFQFPKQKKTKNKNYTALVIFQLFSNEKQDIYFS